MEEMQGGEFFRQERLLGRRIVVILPIFIILMVVTFLFVAMPLRYFFVVQDGDLCLMAGRFTSFGAQRTEILEPIPVQGMDLENLLAQTFETRTDAFAMLRGTLMKRVQDQDAQIYSMEKDLAQPYALQLRYLKGARATGTEGLEKRIAVLQGWLDLYGKKAETLDAGSGRQR